MSKKMFSYRSLFIFILLINSYVSNAQEPQNAPQTTEQGTQPTIYFEKPKPEWKQKMRYGGNIWGQFWGALYIDASPMVGYELNSKGTVAGLGGVLIYKGASQFYTQSTAIGVRPFVRQSLFKSVFLHAEYEIVNANENNFYDFTGSQSTVIRRRWGASPLVGIGLYQGGGGRQKGAYIALMYNLNPDRGFIGSQTLSKELSLRIGFF